RSPRDCAKRTTCATRLRTWRPRVSSKCGSTRPSGVPGSSSNRIAGGIRRGTERGRSPRGQSWIAAGQRGSEREGSVLSLAGDLYQVATGVVEDCDRHGAEVRRLLGEVQACRAQPIVLHLGVVHGERGEGDAVLDECLLERARG